MGGFGPETKLYAGLIDSLIPQYSCFMDGGSNRIGKEIPTNGKSFTEAGEPC